MLCARSKIFSILSFIAVAVFPAVSHAVCSSPAGVAGEMGYNVTGGGEMEYCDDTSWIVMDLGASGSTLVGHWTLDETSGSSLADSSANSNSGTWSDGGDNDVSGETITAKVATGLDYDGAATSVSLGSPADLDNVFSGGGTIAMWFRADGAGENNYGRLFEKAAGTGSSNGYSLTLMNGPTIQFWREFSGGDGTWGSISITYGQWYHIAVVYDDSSASNDPKIYLDGALVTTSDSNSTGTADDDSASDLIIGNSTAGDRTFDGLIDDARVYDGALTAQEVQDLYLSSALVGHWKMDDTSGTTASDSSSSGNDGTMNGGMDAASDTISGQVSTALDFDGGDRIEAGSAATNIDDVFSNGGSISYWVYPVSWGTFGRVVDKSDTGTFPPNGGWHSQGTTGTSGIIKFSHAFSTTYGDWTTSSSVADASQWNHVVVTYDSSATTNDPSVYVNGSLVALTEDSTPVGTAVSDASYPITLGSRNGGGNNMTGRIDDVRLYNTELTASDVMSIYNCSTAGRSYYDSTNNVLKWCGTNVDIKQMGAAGSGGGGCSAGGVLLAGVEGTMQYDTSTNKMVFCDGANWVNIPN